MNGEREPVRLLGASSDAPESLRSALSAAAAGPSPHQLEAMSRAVADAISGDAGGASAPTAGSSVTVAGTVTKLAIVVAVGTGIAFAVWHARVPPRGASPAVAAASPAPSDPAAAAERTEAPLPTPTAEARAVSSATVDSPAVRPGAVRRSPAARASVESAPEPPASAARVPSSAAADELALVRQARASLESHPDRALSVARDHEQRFPHGQFAQERDVIIATALRRLGRAAEAEQAAKAFRARYPNSPYAREIEAPKPE